VCVLPYIFISAAMFSPEVCCDMPHLLNLSSTCIFFLRKVSETVQPNCKAGYKWSPSSMSYYCLVCVHIVLKFQSRYELSVSNPLK